MMKKIYLIIVISFVFTDVRAQWTTGTGNINNTNTGNVGIGNSSPAAKLDVNGNINSPSYMSSGMGFYMETTKEGINNSAGTGYLSFRTNSIDNRMVIDPNGNVGIGTATPITRLDVDGGNAGIYNTGGATSLAIGSSITGKTYIVLSTSADAGGYGTIQSISASGSLFGNTVINPTSGNVLIGKTAQLNTTYILDVAGDVRANEIVVNATGADFVFDPSYRLYPLSGLEKYIEDNHHLPEIASAKQMQADGLNVGENQVKLLQKVEELTLYTIASDKQIKDAKALLSQQQLILKAQQYQINLLIKQVAELTNAKAK